MIALPAVALVLGMHTVQAETMQSNSYQIQFGNFNMTSGTKSSSSYNLTDTVGQTAAGQFTGDGYLVKSGFQYIYPFGEFSFSLSKLTIDFGEITPGTFKTATHQVDVSVIGAGGYSVTVFENHPLRLQSGTSTIPDTTCDNGLCTEETAESWTNPANVGFGFNASGDDVVADFVSANYFRQFADLASAELPQTIMAANSVQSNRTATITYKVTPSGDQPAGLYETQVVFSAIPTY